jgi:hypothetical protein
MLTNQTRAALVQLLQAISPDAIRLLLLKHLGQDIWPIDTHKLLYVLNGADAEGMAGLLVELLAGRTAVRADAPRKFVFDGRLDDFRGRLRADGFEVIEDALVRLLPAAEPAAQIGDYLEQALSACDLDYDGQITRMIRDSHSALSATPPDYNDSTTKARIALETIARRSVSKISHTRGKASPQDTWGPALNFLRLEGVITRAEEEALAKVYTLISPGAHVPKGLTDEQWALLARTFAVSAAYFLLRQHLAA